MFGRRFAAVCVHIVISAVVVFTLISTIPIFACCYRCLANFNLFLILSYCTYFLSKRVFLRGRIDPINKAVIITGCDSGFGKSLAKRLDTKGFRVFASCLFPDGPGAAELKNSCSDRLRIFHMDVTKDESVEKAVSFVKQNLGNSTLWALVNNAGIYKGFPVEFTPVDVFREVMEVNSIGPVRVAKAFLPLLRKSKGRVVNVNSLAGRISPVGTCAYTMSKHAAVALTQCLSQEMNVWGVSVVSIEPEIFCTRLSDPELINSEMDKEFKKISADVYNSYGEDYIKKLKQTTLNFLKLSSPNTDIVVNDIESAIMDCYPNHVYKSRWSIITRLLWDFLSILPDGIHEFVALSCVKATFGSTIPKDLH